MTTAPRWFEVLNVTNGTSTQTGDIYVTPTWAKGLWFHADITAGTTIAIAIGCRASLPDDTSHDLWIASTTFNAIGAWNFLITPGNGTTTNLANDTQRTSSMPPIWRTQMVHSNANATSYTVHACYLTNA